MSIFILIEKILYYPSKIGPLSTNIVIEIPKYSSLSNIASILEDKGIIENKYYFIINSSSLDIKILISLLFELNIDENSSF